MTVTAVICFLAGWFFARMTTRPRRVLTGPGLDVARAVHRPEARRFADLLASKREGESDG